MILPASASFRAPEVERPAFSTALEPLPKPSSNAMTDPVLVQIFSMPIALPLYARDFASNAALPLARMPPVIESGLNRVVVHFSSEFPASQGSGDGLGASTFGMIEARAAELSPLERAGGPALESLSASRRGIDFPVEHLRAPVDQGLNGAVARGSGKHLTGTPAEPNGGRDRDIVPPDLQIGNVNAAFARPGNDEGDLTPDSNWGHGFEVSSRVPVKVTVISQQTHLAPAKGYSNARQGENSMPAAPLALVRDFTSGFALPIARVPPPVEAGLNPAIRQGSNAPASPNRGNMGALAALGGMEASARAHPTLAQPAVSAPDSLPAGPRGYDSPREYRPQAAGRGLDGAVAQVSGKSPSSNPSAPIGGGDGDIASLAHIPAISVNGERHMAVVKEPPPALQIAYVIAASAGFDKFDATAMAAPSGGAMPAAGEAAFEPSRVQTMQVQLEPENLGKVIVKLRLAGAKLDLRIETERPETMRLIGEDRELLAGKLQSAGFAIDTLVIQPAEPQASHHRLGASATSNGQEQPAGHT
ncbi:MAG: flagellar hook-length control protein FliK, partial [Beijerinckiaceae bacterium]|nr:flagellar hook-length control protein FliK [Beijerinckiaceae bacterium]